MLLAIRERIMGVVGWILLGILTIAFGFFGLSSYLQTSTKNYAAMVNEVEIPAGRLQQTYQELRNRMRSMLGDAYDPALLDEDALKASALEQLITQELLRQAADTAGFAASDQLVAAQIKSVDSFREDGAFSTERYERVLAMQRITPAEYERSLKINSMANQLRSGIVQTAAATPAAIQQAYQLQTQKRRFRYLVLRTQDFTGQVEASDADIKAYYDAHTDEFMSPERVRLQYVELSATRLAAASAIDEAELQALYQQESARYTTPEKRRARHILISVLPGADEAAVTEARQRAESVLQRLDAGEDFDALAREVSDDTVSAAAGGDLGFFERDGAMVPEFEAAVFALGDGQRSDLVRTSFGFHIIELMEIKPEIIKPLADVRDELIDQLLAQERADLFYDKSEILSTRAFEQPDTLQGAADALGLEVQESDWITASGGAGIGAHANVVSMAFSEDVLLDGYNSAPIEIDDDHLIVIRVIEHQQSSRKPLEDVKDAVRQQVLDTRAKAWVSAKGGELLGQLKSGTPLETVAEAEGLELQQTELVGRTAKQIDRELIHAAFRLQAPRSGAPVYGGHVLATGDYALIALDEVNTGDFQALPEATRKQALRELNQVEGNSEFMAAMKSLRNAASVSIAESSDQL
ncbi:MAG: SurA N-terminal domain-containing protein [Gammaproteobacteria bacterium]